MLKQKNTWGVIALLAGAYFGVKAIINNSNQNNNPQPLDVKNIDDVVTSTPTKPTVTNNNYPIKWMVYSSALKPLQAVLQIKQDGIFGNDTLKALQVVKPWYDKLYIIENETQLNNLIADVKKYKPTVAPTPKPIAAPTNSRAKQIFDGAKKGKKTIFLKSNNSNKGFLDTFNAFQKTGYRAFTRGTVIQPTEVVSYSSQYIYWKKDKETYQTDQSILTNV